MSQKIITTGEAQHDAGRGMNYPDTAERDRQRNAEQTAIGNQAHIRRLQTSVENARAAVLLAQAMLDKAESKLQSAVAQKAEK